MRMARHTLCFLLAWMLVPAAGYSAPAADSPDPRGTVLVMLRAAPDHYRPESGYGGGYGDISGRVALTRIARRVAHDHHLRLLGDWPMPTLGIDCFVMMLTDDRAPKAVADEVSRDAGVSWAQPLQTYRTQATAVRSPDPLLLAQPAERLWRVSDLHRIASGRGVTVAVVDSRVDAHHPDLAGQVAAQQDFVGGHGTEVAGVIAARAGNGIGIAGVAPAARLLALRACWETPAEPGAVCDSLSIAEALHYAIERRAGVVNLSLSGPRDLLLARLIEVGLAHGTIFVAAVDRTSTDGGFPASQPGVIGVVDQAMIRPGEPFYTAPGRDVPTTAPGGRWLLVNGSSFAAAHVSGLMALTRERGGRPLTLPARTAGGMVDACRTLRCAGRARDISCAGDCRVVVGTR